jgi:predicted ATPase
MVARLLTIAPQLKVLVTSRARLHVRAEHEFAVEPLEQHDAVELFVQRAHAAQSSLTRVSLSTSAVAEICRRLDGLPLAIELAAARTKVLPPAELLKRLKRRLPVLTGGPRDLPARQRTMRDAIGWSYELLGASEQSVLQQLSVCVGGCTLDAAEAIVRRAPRDGAIASGDLLESVAVLVDHSLVCVREDSSAEPRLTMLEIVREYGLECSAAGGASTPARERHALYYLNYAELASARLMGPGQSGGLEQLDLELGNLRAVLEWAAERDAHELGLRTATALAPYWFFRGYFAEGRAWIDRWLALTSGNAEVNAWRLSALYGAAQLALEQGDYPRVAAVAAETESLARELENALGMAQALEMQAVLLRLGGDALGGRAVLEQALLWSRQSGNGGQIARTLSAMGNLSRELGDFPRAEIVLEELLADARKNGPMHGEARALAFLGQLAREQGDYKRAGQRYCEAIGVFQKLRDPVGLAYSFEGVAALARVLGDMQGTTLLYGAAASLRESVASTLTPAERRSCETDLAAAQAALGEEAFTDAWTTGQALAVDSAIAVALDCSRRSAAP